MPQVIRIIFNYQSGFYSAIITVIREFDTDFIDIEFVDEEMIGAFNASGLSYVGKGFKKLPHYRSVQLRFILNSLHLILKNAQHISIEQDANILLAEEYVRRN
jgi:hypothetical protein